MYATAESIARQLGGARKAGDDWSCKCPAHEDKKASLSIKDTENGKLLVHCHAGCAQDDVVNQLKIMGLWSDSPRRVKAEPPKVEINLPSIAPGRGSIAATYDYTDEHGTLLYQAVRYEPKDFRQRRPLEGGGWSWSIKGVQRVLYRLPEILQAVAAGNPILICEGEKDVEAARALGLTATCNAMGADNGTGNKWLKEFGEIFKGADVIVIPDQDDPGKRHAEWVISTLDGFARNVGIANPKVGKDLADWIDSGAKVDDIFEATVDAFERSGAVSATRGSLLKVGDLIKDIKPIEWLVRDYFERDSIALVYGSPGSGKSFFTVDIACSIATGNPWFGHSIHQGTVIYIAGEGHNGLARRFKGWEVSRGVSLSDAELYKSAGSVQVLDEESVLGMSEEIYQVAESTGQPVSMIVIDTLARNFGPGDENSTEDMSTFIQHVDHHLRQRFNCCVLIVHHSGHNAERARGSSALKAAVDAEYEISKDDSGNVKIKTTKMKDAELPPEMMLRLKGVELPDLFDEDGKPVTSAIMEVANDLIMSKVAERGDGTKILAKDAMAVLDRQWLSIRALGEALACSKSQAETVMRNLRRYGFITEKGVTLEGKEALSRTGHQLMKNDKPVWKREEAQA